jgi:hypothetical protein
MARLRRPYVSCTIWLLICTCLAPANVGAGDFPFERELILDAAPLSGSKRVPILEIDMNGAVSIDLWCTSLRGQANVSDDAINIVLGPVQPAQCAPDRQPATKTCSRRSFR